MKVRFVTLGCKVNAEETQQLREGLLRAGFVPAREDEKADLTVVNTCSVTHLSDAKSRRSIEA
ncbi:MAG: tRNA (N(6)-L-threonylcarbamoyladenosine(37)-C(2))-methylthiotransferase MtaB, partial [Bacillota bacterium]|nr:tRNA (N(6)-L-threonylcarbamoyladenosine(37)-C(2))-methylthiotransferase MtaB [Bacillota bacterium]